MSITTFDKDESVNLYFSTIGSLLYLTTSRSYISLVYVYAQDFRSSSKISHLVVVERIIISSRATLILGFFYPKDISFDLSAIPMLILLRAKWIGKGEVALANF